ncbi:MAG: ArnT family glycosyltransferase [Cytophagales bacterium]
MTNLFSKLNITIVFVAIGVVYFIGMFVDVMDIDAAQYASLAREMLDSSGFLQVKLRNVDYLDKPPLSFWLASLSFWAFGYSNLAYKLPSVLFSILAIYSTFRFAKIYYSKEIAILSAVILATTQAFFLINNDCRTDTVLIGCIAFASWHLAGYLKCKNWPNFIFAFVGISFAMLSKGPLGLMVPVLGFGFDLLLKKDFKNIFQWQWLVGLVVIAIFLAPMCLGLYQQYGIKGLQFYFWDQSFGRITGSNSTWKNDPDPFFLLHSFAWSFLPWPLLFFTAVFFKLKTLWIQKFKVIDNQEFITISAIVFSYLILSRSQYQLPHYIYSIFPFSSILTAAFVFKLVELGQKWVRSFYLLQMIVCIILLAVVAVLSFWPFQFNALQVCIFASMGILFIYLIFQKEINQLHKIILLSTFTAIGVNLLMNSHVYPSLLKYQPSHEIADYLRSKNVDERHFFIFNDFYSHSLDFYTQSVNQEVVDLAFFETLKEGEVYYCYTNSKGLEILTTNQIKYTLVGTYLEYPVTRVSLPFLNPSTRAERLVEKYLISL